MLRHRHWGQVLGGQCLCCMHKSRAVVEVQVVQEVQLLLLSRGRCLSCMLLAYQTRFWLSVPIIAPLPPPRLMLFTDWGRRRMTQVFMAPNPQPPINNKITALFTSELNWSGVKTLSFKNIFLLLGSYLHLEQQTTDNSPRGQLLAGSKTYLYSLTSPGQKWSVLKIISQSTFASK